MQRLMRFVLYLLSLVAGGMLAYTALYPDFGLAMFDYYAQRLPETSGRIGTGAVGAVLFLLPLALFVRWYASRRYAKEIGYQTENGSVSVSLQAIEEALVRALEHDEAVRKVALRVYDDRMKRQVSITCALTLWDDGDVTGINRRCQELLRSRFRELMPEQTDVAININVHRLTQRAEVPKTPVVEAADEPKRKEPGPLPLPGLQATAGQITNQAGAALLANTKQRKQTASEVDQTAVDEVPTGQHQRTEALVDPTPAQGTDIDFNAIEEELAEDPLQNLYVGPQYYIDDDDEEEDKVGK